MDPIDKLWQAVKTDVIVGEAVASFHVVDIIPLDVLGVVQFFLFFFKTAKKKED